MKELLGKSYDELMGLFRVKTQRHYFSSDENNNYSTFIDDNEYLFVDNALSSIELSNFANVHAIPGFVFSIEEGIEKTLQALAKASIRWEIYSRYSKDHWIVILLNEHCVQYEYEFVDRSFKLQYIRLELRQIEDERQEGLS